MSNNLDLVLKIANTNSVSHLFKARKLIRNSLEMPLELLPIEPVLPRNYCDDDLDNLYNPVDWRDTWWQI
jgi:hypothetical protein